MQRTIATLLGILALASTTALALAPAAAAADSSPVSDTEAPGQTTQHHCWYVIVPEQEVGPVSVAIWQCDPQIEVNESWEPSTTGTQEHCWSLGAEAGPATVIYNPCGEEIGVDTSPDSDDDDVTVHRGYDENTIAEIPGDPFGNGTEHPPGFHCDPSLTEDPRPWAPRVCYFD